MQLSSPKTFSLAVSLLFKEYRCETICISHCWVFTQSEIVTNKTKLKFLLSTSKLLLLRCFSMIAWIENARWLCLIFRTENVSVPAESSAVFLHKLTGNESVVKHNLKPSKRHLKESLCSNVKKKLLELFLRDLLPVPFPVRHVPLRMFFNFH